MDLTTKWNKLANIIYCGTEDKQLFTLKQKLLFDGY